MWIPWLNLMRSDQLLVNLKWQYLWLRRATFLPNQVLQTRSMAESIHNPTTHGRNTEQRSLDCSKRPRVSDSVKPATELLGLPLPLLKFSGGSVTFYATFSTDTAMPSC